MEFLDHTGTKVLDARGQPTVEQTILSVSRPLAFLAGQVQC